MLSVTQITFLKFLRIQPIKTIKTNSESIFLIITRKNTSLKFIYIFYHPCVNFTPLIPPFFFVPICKCNYQFSISRTREKILEGFNKRKKNKKLHTLLPLGLTSTENEMIKIKKFVIFSALKARSRRKAKKSSYLSTKK